MNISREYKCQSFEDHAPFMVVFYLLESRHEMRDWWIPSKYLLWFAIIKDEFLTAIVTMDHELEAIFDMFLVKEITRRLECSQKRAKLAVFYVEKFQYHSKRTYTRHLTPDRYVTAHVSFEYLAFYFIF